jgi:hypothetical protein
VAAADLRVHRRLGGARRRPPAPADRTATGEEAELVLANLNGIQVHYADHGSGLPVLGLHGGGVDHREIMGA